MRKGVDLTGRRFGRLFVIGKSETKSADRKTLWDVICDCGVFKKVRTHAIAKGGTISCGCYQKERKFKHGHTLRSKEMSKEYKCWVGIRSRCLDSKNKSYKNYGGSGIKLYSEWQTNFTEFLAHVGEAPTKDHVIDRIDSSGDYAPGNVRWVTKSQSCMNRREFKNSAVKYKGVSITTNGKYRARVHVAGKTVFYKTFDTPEAAATAYDEAAKKYHGEFAVLNNVISEQVRNA
jgi:hypothetical protein